MAKTNISLHIFSVISQLLALSRMFFARCFFTFKSCVSLFQHRVKVQNSLCPKETWMSTISLDKANTILINKYLPRWVLLLRWFSQLWQWLLTLHIHYPCSVRYPLFVFSLRAPHHPSWSLIIKWLTSPLGLQPVSNSSFSHVAVTHRNMYLHSFYHTAHRVDHKYLWDDFL